MRVSAGLPTGMEGLTYPIPFSDPENVIKIAQAAEKFGYDSVWGNDHMTTQNYVRAEFLRGRLGDVPEVAIVLGSGLGDFADSLGDATTIAYTDIPHWPASKVMGHAGKLVAGQARGRRILVLAGRVHFYEGHDLHTVTFATRVMGALGVRQLILTNAAGGINTAFAQGALMLIDDHINLLGSNPLVVANDERFGPRFPDMTEVYSSRLRALAREAAAAANAATSWACHAAS